MARRKFEELVQDLRNEGLDDLAEELSEYSGTRLRKALEEAERELARIPELERQVASAQKGSKVKDALAAVDLDFDSLSKAEKRAIEAADVDLDDEEAVRNLVTELELVSSEGQGESQGEPTGASQVVQQARTAPQGGGRSKTTIGPADISEWPMEKKMRFRESNPDEWEALKRGEKVAAPA